MTLERWRALGVREQLQLWLAVPDDQRPAYVAEAHPVAALVLRCSLQLGGDLALDRLIIKEAIQGGDWMKHGFDLAELRDDDELLNGFIDRLVQCGQAKQNWEQSLDPAALDLWPAARLVVTMGRMKPGTKERWQAAGGRLFGGRMIALRTSPVWSRFSLFGRPHGPYDHFNFWLDVEDVDCDEARRIGLI